MSVNTDSGTNNEPISENSEVKSEMEVENEGAKPEVENNVGLYNEAAMQQAALMNSHVYDNSSSMVPPTVSINSYPPGTYMIGGQIVNNVPSNMMQSPNPESISMYPDTQQTLVNSMMGNPNNVMYANQQTQNVMYMNPQNSNNIIYQNPGNLMYSNPQNPGQVMCVNPQNPSQIMYMNAPQQPQSMYYINPQNPNQVMIMTPQQTTNNVMYVNPQNPNQVMYMNNPQNVNNVMGYVNPQNPNQIMYNMNPQIPPNNLINPQQNTMMYVDPQNPNQVMYLTPQSTTNNMNYANPQASNTYQPIPQTVDSVNVPSYPTVVNQTPSQPESNLPPQEAPSPAIPAQFPSPTPTEATTPVPATSPLIANTSPPKRVRKVIYRNPNRAILPAEDTSQRNTESLLVSVEMPPSSNPNKKLKPNCNPRHASVKMLLAAKRSLVDKGPEIICAGCVSTFASDVHAFNRHTCLKNKEKRCYCNHCFQLFFTLKDYNGHICKQPDHYYNCNVCNSKFKTVDMLHKHNFLHTRNNAFSCPVCQLIFQTPRILENHMECHKKEKAQEAANIVENTLTYDPRLFPQSNMVHAGMNIPQLQGGSYVVDPNTYNLILQSMHGGSVMYTPPPTAMSNGGPSVRENYPISSGVQVTDSQQANVNTDSAMPETRTLSQSMAVSYVPETNSVQVENSVCNSTAVQVEDNVCNSTAVQVENNVCNSPAALEETNVSNDHVVQAENNTRNSPVVQVETHSCNSAAVQAEATEALEAFEASLELTCTKVDESKHENCVDEKAACVGGNELTAASTSSQESENSTQNTRKNVETSDMSHVITPDVSINAKEEVDVKIDSKSVCNDVVINVNNTSEPLMEIQMLTDNLKSNETVTKDSNQQFSCQNCKKTFSTSAQFNEHPCNKKTYTCKYGYCNKIFTGPNSFAEFSKHFKKEHDPNDVATFCCTECSQKFKSFQQLKLHCKLDHLKDLIHCSVCNIVYPNEEELEQHMLNHKLEPGYTCIVCSAKFAFVRSMTRHMREVHTVLTQQIPEESEQVQEPPE